VESYGARNILTALDFKPKIEHLAGYKSSCALSEASFPSTFSCFPHASPTNTPRPLLNRRFDTEKGFGFIVPDDGTTDVFVHQSAIKKEGFRSLADGEPVQYEVEKDERSGKTKAVSVTGPGGEDVKGAPFQQEDDDGWYEN